MWCGDCIEKEKSVFWLFLGGVLCCLPGWLGGHLGCCRLRADANTRISQTHIHSDFFKIFIRFLERAAYRLCETLQTEWCQTKNHLNLDQDQLERSPAFIQGIFSDGQDGQPLLSWHQVTQSLPTLLCDTLMVQRKAFTICPPQRPSTNYEFNSV